MSEPTSITGTEAKVEEIKINGNGHANGNGNAHLYTNGHAVKREGLKFERYFTQEGVGPFASLEWEKRDAVIKSADGKVVFEKLNVEVPKFWSQNATNIIASKYFYGDKEKGQREQSVRELIDRVTQTITDWGKADGYFEVL